jgi:hypothetical protein
MPGKTSEVPALERCGDRHYKGLGIGLRNEFVLLTNANLPPVALTGRDGWKIESPCLSGRRSERWGGVWSQDCRALGGSGAMYKATSLVRNDDH